MGSQFKENKYDGLILSSCGSELFKILGYICKLDDEYKFLKNITSISTSGISSILSLLLASQFTPMEIMFILNKSKLITLLIIYLTKNINIHDLAKIYEIDDDLNVPYIEEHITAILAFSLRDKFSVVPTLENLYYMTGKTIYFSSYDKMKKEYISRHNYPNMSCIEACLKSLNLKLSFECHVNNLNVDGGFMDPFPVSILEEKNILSIYSESNFTRTSMLTELFTYAILSNLELNNITTIPISKTKIPDLTSKKISKLCHININLFLSGMNYEHEPICVIEDI